MRNLSGQTGHSAGWSLIEDQMPLPNGIIERGNRCVGKGIHGDSNDGYYLKINASLQVTTANEFRPVNAGLPLVIYLGAYLD